MACILAVNTLIQLNPVYHINPGADDTSPLSHHTATYLSLLCRKLGFLFANVFRLFTGRVFHDLGELEKSLNMNMRMEGSKVTLFVGFCNSVRYSDSATDCQEKIYVKALYKAYHV